MHGMSLHAYAIRVLSQHAKQTPMPAAPLVQPPDPADKLTELLQIWVPLELAQRLQSAAHQLRDEDDNALASGTLARLLLTHDCLEETNIIQQMNEQVNPDYVDMTPFTGRVKYSRREYRDLHMLLVHCSMATRDAVHARARDEGITITQLVRNLLDARLPALPHPEWNR